MNKTVKKILMAVFCLSLIKVMLAEVPNQLVVQEGDAPVESATVSLDGDTLLRVRGMTGYSAANRADAISDRIKKLAADPTVNPEAIQIVDSPDRTSLMYGDTLITHIFDSDAALEKARRPSVAEGARINMIQAIQRYRRDRQPAILFRRILIALGVTLLLAFVLMGARRLFKWSAQKAEQHIKARMDEIENRSSKVIDTRPMWAAVLGILRGLRFILLAIIFYFYLNSVLGLFPWTRPVATHLVSFILKPLSVLGNGFINFIPDLIFLTILVFITRYVLNVIQIFFSAIQQGTLQFESFDQDWAWPTYRLVRVFVIAFAVVVAYPYIPGSNSDAFKGVSLFIGVLFSLGSTSFISNMIAGLALTYRRAFKVGDIIKVDNVVGLVTEMRMQTSHLRTVHNEAITIPNTSIVNSNVINYSVLARTKGVAMHTTVNIGYGTPWRQVEAMLLMAAERTPDVVKDPKPFVRQMALNEFAIAYELGAYLKDPNRLPWAYTELHKNVLDIFNEYGVQIMVPSYEGDPENPKIVSKDQMFAAPAKPS